jgi:hypothetical protein
VLIVRVPLNRISALSRQTSTFQTPSKHVVFSSCRPGFWNDVFDLVILHGRQPRQYVVQISVGFDVLTPAAFDDRINNRTAFARRCFLFVKNSLVLTPASTNNLRISDSAIRARLLLQGLLKTRFLPTIPKAQSSCKSFRRCQPRIGRRLHEEARSSSLSDLLYGATA